MFTLGEITFTFGEQITFTFGEQITFTFWEITFGNYLEDFRLFGIYFCVAEGVWGLCGSGGPVGVFEKIQPVEKVGAASALLDFGKNWEVKIPHCLGAWAGRKRNLVSNLSWSSYVTDGAHFICKRQNIWGFFLKPQPPTCKAKIWTNIWPLNCQICLALKDLGSYFVQIFVHVFALYVGGRGPLVYFWILDRTGM